MISPFPLIMHLFPFPSVCHPPLCLSSFGPSSFPSSSAHLLVQLHLPSGHSVPHLFLRLPSSNLFQFLLQSSPPLMNRSIILSSILPISYTLFSFYVVFHSPPPPHLFFYSLLQLFLLMSYLNPFHIFSHLIFFQQPNHIFLLLASSLSPLRTTSLLIYSSSKSNRL